MSLENDSGNQVRVLAQYGWVADHYEVLDRSKTDLWRWVRAVFDATASELGSKYFLTSMSVVEEQSFTIINASKPGWPKHCRNDVHYRQLGDWALPTTFSECREAMC